MHTEMTFADQYGSQVVADTVRCAGGWRARTICWLATGSVEVIECPLADSSEAVAMQRARALAWLRYSDGQALH